MEAVNYKCPCCGAGLEYSALSGKWDCGACQNSFELKTLQEYEKAVEASAEPSRLDFDAYAGSEQAAAPGYVCPSCGAEIQSDGVTAATRCLYCGNPTVLPRELSGAFRPDLVAPFAVTRDRAEDALRKFMRHKPLLPKGFATESRVEEIAGVYIPYWLFDCHSEADISYNATRSHSHREGKYLVTRTDHYLARRRGGVDFENLPVDGSSKFTAEQTESIEPFDLKKAQPFDPAYLSGFLADRYDQDAEACAPRASQRVDESTKSLFQGTVSGYESAVPRSAHVEVQRGRIRYALLPVWLLNSQYKKNTYSFQVNGQTGKISGNLPVSRGKFWAWLLGVAAGATAAALLVMALVMKVGGGL